MLISGFFFLVCSLNAFSNICIQLRTNNHTISICKVDRMTNLRSPRTDLPRRKCLLLQILLFKKKHELMCIITVLVPQLIAEVNLHLQPYLKTLRVQNRCDQCHK